MPGRTQDGLHVLLVQRLDGTGQDLGEAARMDQRHHDADLADPRPVGPRDAGARAGRIAMFPDHLLHGFPRLAGHVGVPVDHAGDRRDGHAG
jgi:hypothetical protein